MKAHFICDDGRIFEKFRSQLSYGFAHGRSGADRGHERRGRGGNIGDAVGAEDRKFRDGKKE